MASYTSARGPYPHFSVKEKNKTIFDSRLWLIVRILGYYHSSTHCLLVWGGIRGQERWTTGSLKELANNLQDFEKYAH